MANETATNNATNTTTTNTNSTTDGGTPPVGPVPAKVKLTTLDPKELTLLLSVARDRNLPLAARKEVLAAYDVPDGVYSPDPGIGDKISAAAATALVAVVGAATGAVALVFFVSSVRGLLRLAGVLPPLPPALPPAAPAPTPLQLPPLPFGGGTQPGFALLRGAWLFSYGLAVPGIRARWKP